MGAEQSSTQDRSGPQNATGQPPKSCYYDILAVDRQASDEEIKKAYRRKALELHPDRNYGNAEDATKKFAEVQSAYQILSDPKERAWYDSHRDAILRQDDGDIESYSEHNVRLTTARDIVNLIGKFTPTMPFTDASDGFYGILRETFITLADEENAVQDWEDLEVIIYPEFGGKTASYEDIVRPFYATWMSFSTRKTFSWRDEYNYTEAPDRRVRRLMEKENKRLREEAIREFNDAVRSLVSFVRKRDPRYIPNNQSEADRQKILRDAAAAQAARSRAAHEAKLDRHVVPVWAQTRDLEETESVPESEESEEELYECVICRKTFKSEKQWEAHERSKKHIKSVQQLRRQIQKEDKHLNLDQVSPSRSASPLNPAQVSEVELEEQGLGPRSPLHPGAGSGRNSLNLPSDTNTVPQEGHAEEHAEEHVEEKGPFDAQVSDRGAISGSETASEIDSINDEYVSREKVESRFSSLNGARETPPDSTERLIDEINDLKPSNDNGGNHDEEPGKSHQKVGKAKNKRARKAASQAATGQNAFICETCKEQFSSKTKLFKHIESDGHAQPISRTNKGVKGRA